MAKAMFTTEYVFRGKYAQYARTLADSAFENETGIKVFTSAIELYITCAVIGLLNEQRAVPEKGETYKVFADQFRTHYDDCMFVFRLVMLLHEDVNIDPKERINNAFKYPRNPNDPHNELNEKIFEEYMLGGLTILYEQFFDAENKRYEDYLNSLKQFINSINKDDSMEDEVDDIDYSPIF